MGLLEYLPYRTAQLEPERVHGVVRIRTLVTDADWLPSLTKTDHVGWILLIVDKVGGGCSNMGREAFSFCIPVVRRQPVIKCSDDRSVSRGRSYLIMTTLHYWINRNNQVNQKNQKFEFSILPIKQWDTPENSIEFSVRYKDNKKFIKKSNKPFYKLFLNVLWKRTFIHSPNLE